MNRFLNGLMENDNYTLTENGAVTHKSTLSGVMDMFASSGRDYHFYITDASGDGRVIEYDINGELRELIDTPSEAVTNFFIRYKDQVLPNQKNDIYGHGRERYDAVLQVFENEKGNYTSDTVWNAMKSAAQDPSTRC